MLNEQQINSTTTFANTVGAFINQDGVPLFMDRSQDGDTIKNGFFIYGKHEHKYFLGEINFQVGSSNFDCFIDGEVIQTLKSEGLI